MKNLPIALFFLDCDLDLVLIIDTSGSIGNNLGLVTDFAVSIVTSLYNTIDSVSVGLIVFSDNARSVFLLNTYETLEEVTGRIRGLVTTGGEQKSQQMSVSTYLMSCLFHRVDKHTAGVDVAAN